MFFGLGITESGYLAEMQYHRYSLSHQVTSYRDERYVTQSVGVDYSFFYYKPVKFLTRVRAGLEYHYESIYYAKNYIVINPEVGLRFKTIRPIGIQAFITPLKFFYKTTGEDKYTQNGFRWDPSMVISIAIYFPNKGVFK